ncbi:MAG: GAF domain-containing protein, partial [Thermomicrobiales bacterium]
MSSDPPARRTRRHARASQVPAPAPGASHERSASAHNRRDERSEQLQELTAALSAALDPEGVGAAIIRHAMPALEANAGNVFLFDANRRELVNVALLGYEPEIVEWSRQLPLDGVTMVAAVVRTGEPIFLPSWEERVKLFPHHRTIHARGGDRAVAGLPLKVEGRTIGAISLAFPTDRTFDLDDRRFMATVADLCAQALERARLYEAVQLSESRFRHLADSMPQIAWIFGGDGTTLEYLNERWSGYTGKRRLPATISDFNDPIHPDDLPGVIESWSDSLRTRRTFQCELRLRGRDGAYRWFLSRAVPVYDRAEKVVQWFGTSTDIDETKRAESNQRFLAELGKTLADSLDTDETLRRVTRLLTPALADYCFVDLVRPDGQIRRVAWAHVDPAEQRLFDERLAHFLPLRLHEEHPISRTLESGEAQFISRVTDDWLERIAFSAEHLDFMRGRRLHSQITVPLRARDRIQGVLTLCFTVSSGRRYSREDLEFARDVADRVGLAVDNARLYTDMREAEAKIRRLLDAGVIGIIVTDDEHILEANDHFLEMVGYTREELASGRLRWPEMTPPEYAGLDAFAVEELHERGVATSFEKEYIRRDGSRLPILIGIAALDRTAPLFICFILDLTERKRAETEWRAFVDATAHDLRNPLTAVLGQTQLLQRRLRRHGAMLPGDADTRLAAIASAATRAADLIDDLMDTARLGAGQLLELRPTTVDLVAIANACAGEARRVGPTHSVRLESETTALAVHADGPRIGRVVRNVLDNAVKYS